MPRLHVTTAICTWNRSRSLGTTLASLRRLKVSPDTRWDVLVVNNNCTDDTDAVLARFADCLPLSVAFESRQGLSHARNRAVEATGGDYILWTDDDTVVDPGWLEAYVEAIGRWPEAAVFGGPITPKFEGTPPRWLVRATAAGTVSNAYAARDLGPSPIALDPSNDKIPYGANYAVRMTEQRAYAYDPRLGPNRGEHLVGEETNVMRRILGAGFEGRWVPGAGVEHMIPKERQTEAYLRTYYVGLGRTIARTNSAGAERQSVGSAAWIWLAGAALPMKYIMTRYTAPPTVWCDALKKMSVARGLLMEYRATSRGD